MYVDIEINRDQAECANFSPDLVVMGGESFSEGCGFESQHRILEGHFSHLFFVKIVMFV